MNVNDAGTGHLDGAAVVMDVDLNNDGDFTGAGETAYATSTLTGIQPSGSSSSDSYSLATATFAFATALPDGTYHLRVRARDQAGNEGTSGVATMVVDTTVPTVTINQAAGQADPTHGSTINFTVVFSEPVVDFAADDVTLHGWPILFAGPTGSSGTAANSSLTAVVTGSGTTYNVAVSGMAGAER